MMRSSIRAVSSLALLGALLLPSHRLIDQHKRTHRQHATCEHHLRAHHPDPADRARVLRRAERRRRHEQRQREEDERANAEAARVAMAEVAEGSIQATQAAADPQDDDFSLKRKRPRTGKGNRFWAFAEPPEIRRAGDFLANLRAKVIIADRPEIDRSDLPHFGSGPCHQIHRPREGTTLPALPLSSRQA